VAFVCLLLSGLAIGLAVALVAWLQLGCFGLAIGLAAANVFG